MAHQRLTCLLLLLGLAAHHGWTTTSSTTNNAAAGGSTSTPHQHQAPNVVEAFVGTRHFRVPSRSAVATSIAQTTTVSPSSSSSSAKSLLRMMSNNEVLVDNLLEAIEMRNNNNNGDIETDKKIKNLIQELTDNESATSSSSSASSLSTPSDFDALLGYYNVSCTLTARPNDNPVGGKWTRNGSTYYSAGGANKNTTPKLWVIRRTLQHLLPKRENSSIPNAVAQAINVIRLDLLFGWIPVWIVLRGDAVPLDQDTDNYDDDDKKSPALVPGLSSRAVRAYFDRPRIAFGKRLVFSFGPTSSVVLDAPYVDERIRVGKGGTSGTLFVFRRVPQEDAEATTEWKWLLEEDRQKSFVTKRKAAMTIGVVGILSALGSKLLVGGVAQKISLTSTLLSTIGLIWVALGTGGIETRGDTYARGK